MRILVAGLAAFVLALPLRAEGVSYAGGAGSGVAEADDGGMPSAPPGDESAWRLCRVDFSVLLNVGGRSEVVRHEERKLFHGEEITIEGEAQASAGSRHALLAYRVRLRAAVARPEGVVYHVTSSARLASTIGFSGDAVGHDEIRHAFLEIGDLGTRLHEVFAMPDPALRLVLGVSAQPLVGADEPESFSGGPASLERLEKFRVEVVAREDGTEKLLDRVDLTAAPHRPGRFSVGQLSARRREAEDPARRLGAGVRAVDLGSLPDSGYGRDHVNRGVPVDRSWEDEHLTSPDDDYLLEHRVTIDRDDDPRHVTVQAKKRKLSKRKQAKLRQQQEIIGAVLVARERARTLPSGEDVPEGFRREELTLTLTPLHVGTRWLQVAIRLEGAVVLPGEDRLTPVALESTEQLERGVVFEIALAEVLQEGEPAYDYVIRIVPSS